MALQIPFLWLPATAPKGYPAVAGSQRGDFGEAGLPFGCLPKPLLLTHQLR